MNALTVRRSIITGTVIVVLVGLLGYGLFEGRRILQGPRLHITMPLDGSATSSTQVELGGIAENISFLTINDEPSYIDETGHFTQMLSLAPGYAIFTVSATDRFGRRASEQVHITVLNYCPASERNESLTFSSERA
jgi:hypothetical protein